MAEGRDRPTLRRDLGSRRNGIDRAFLRGEIGGAETQRHTRPGIPPEQASPSPCHNAQPEPQNDPKRGSGSQQC